MRPRSSACSRGDGLHPGTLCFNASLAYDRSQPLDSFCERAEISGKVGRGGGHRLCQSSKPHDRLCFCTREAVGARSFRAAAWSSVKVGRGGGHRLCQSGKPHDRTARLPLPIRLKITRRNCCTVRHPHAILRDMSNAKSAGPAVAIGGAHMARRHLFDVRPVSHGAPLGGLLVVASNLGILRLRLSPCRVARVLQHDAKG